MAAYTKSAPAESRKHDGNIVPELPEAETIAKYLDQHLRGASLGRVVLSRCDMVHATPMPIGRILPGCRIERVHRRGKRILLSLSADGPGKGSGPAELVFHLGMSGRLTISQISYALEPHTHLRIAVAGTTTELRFRDPRRFGGVWLLIDGMEQTARIRAVSAKRASRPRGRDVLGLLGPEPLEIAAPAFRRILQRRRQIKALLMDQRIIAGLGNIYCDEALFAARIHPLCHADSLDSAQAGRLLRAIKSTLNKAICHNGSTLLDYRRGDGQAGSFQRLHRVYGREGQECRKCGTLIVRIQAAGRSTHICPMCQRVGSQNRRKPRRQTRTGAATNQPRRDRKKGTPLDSQAPR